MLELLRKIRKKRHAIEDGGKYYQATVVSPEKVDVDEAGLRKEIGAVAFRKISVQKLDRKLLEAALESGALDPQIVGKHLHTKESRPYIRYTEGVTDDADEPTNASD